MCVHERHIHPSSFLFVCWLQGTCAFIQLGAWVSGRCLHQQPHFIFFFLRYTVTRGLCITSQFFFFIFLPKVLPMNVVIPCEHKGKQRSSTPIGFKRTPFQKSASNLLRHIFTPPKAFFNLSIFLPFFFHFPDHFPPQKGIYFEQSGAQQ